MDVQKFIGLAETQARTLANASGLIVVVGTGVPTLLTNALQMNRLTLTLVDGRVTGAKLG